MSTLPQETDDQIEWIRSHLRTLFQSREYDTYDEIGKVCTNAINWLIKEELIDTGWVVECTQPVLRFRLIITNGHDTKYADFDWEIIMEGKDHFKAYDQAMEVLLG